MEDRKMNISTTGGLRDNIGKPRLSLVPASLEEAVAHVILKSSEQGGGKYPMHNWRKGMSWSEVSESAMRHLKAWAQKGEDLDQETGLNHLWHAATNIAFLIEYVQSGVGQDDRYKKTEIREAGKPPVLRPDCVAVCDKSKDTWKGCCR